MDFAALPQQPAQFIFGSEQISLGIPNANWILEHYHHDNGMGFPYWTKIWPAAFALASWMSDHKTLFHQKSVVELGAGLALPSLLAARWANAVVAADHHKQAIEFLNQNLQQYRYSNVQAIVFDWRSRQVLPEADILLLADVNYSPSNFEPLLQLINQWQQQGKTILLTTPPRLSGRTFVEKLVANGFQHTLLPESVNAPGVTCSLFSIHIDH